MQPMQDQGHRFFGTYRRWILPIEEPYHAGCPLEVMSIVLLLRRFLTDVDGVFYKTDWNYDSSDACMSETTIYLYRRPRDWETARPVLTEYLHIVHDSASNIYLPTILTPLSLGSDYWPHSSEGANSFGSITHISVFDGSEWSYKDTPKQAIIRIIKDIVKQHKGAHLRVRRAGELQDGSYQLEVWREGYPTLRLGVLYANEHENYWYTRFLDNCVLDLRD